MHQLFTHRLCPLFAKSIIRQIIKKRNTFCTHYFKLVWLKKGHFPCEIRNAYQSALFSPLCVLHQLSCVAGGMPCVGDQIINVIHNIAVRSDDGKSPRNLLHAIRVIGVVKPFRLFNLTLYRMIWE